MSSSLSGRALQAIVAEPLSELWDSLGSDSRLFRSRREVRCARLMPIREAACHCGQLRLEVTGDPFAVSICNCLACQRRTGTALRDAGGLQGRGGAGRRSLQRLRAHLGRGRPEGSRLPLLPRVRLAGLLHGAARAVVGLGATSLRGRQVRGGGGQGPRACCESLAGRPADAVEHLRRAIEMWEGCREMAKADSDFDPIRDEPAFQEPVGR